MEGNSKTRGCSTLVPSSALEEQVQRHPPLGPSSVLEEQTQPHHQTTRLSASAWQELKAHRILYLGVSTHAPVPCSQRVHVCPTLRPQLPPPFFGTHPALHGAKCKLPPLPYLTLTTSSLSSGQWIPLALGSGFLWLWADGPLYLWAWTPAALGWVDPSGSRWVDPSSSGLGTISFHLSSSSCHPHVPSASPFRTCAPHPATPTVPQSSARFLVCLFQHSWHPGQGHMQHPGSVRVSTAVINTMAKSNLGRKGFISSYSSS